MGAETLLFKDEKRPGERAQRWTARVLIAASLVVGACASDSPRERLTANEIEADPRLGFSEDTVCFAGRVSGFYAIGDRALVLRRTSDEAYLISTGFCPNLDHVEAIALPEPSRCLSRGDRLFVSDTVFPDRSETADRTNRCLVTDIRAWDEDASSETGSEGD